MVVIRWKWCGFSSDVTGRPEESREVWSVSRSLLDIVLKAIDRMLVSAGNKSSKEFVALCKFTVVVRGSRYC